MTELAAPDVAELTARSSYGRLLALLTLKTRDIAAAEDALADAFAAALSSWPRTGIPANPDAWILTAARNTLENRRRHEAVRFGSHGEIERRSLELVEIGTDFPDERLKLLFVCAHPAIDPSIRAPLMLQAVLGLDAARIADAFLVAPAAMGQRLVRAKLKIRDAGLRFEVPDTDQLAGRLPDVLDAIYTAFGTGWEAFEPGTDAVGGLAEEAIYLGRLVAAMLPGEAEALGLLSLMLHCHARRHARRAADGAFVPLSAQDWRLWDRAMVAEAERQLMAAASLGRPGRYQCEAAIQSIHAQRPLTRQPHHVPLLLLYDDLVRRVPSFGALVARASARLDAGDLDGALSSLSDVPDAIRARYQPYWVTLSACLAKAGRWVEADDAMARALDLTQDPAIRAHLGRVRSELGAPPPVGM